MIEQDTIRLLRECDAGVQMGTQSIADILPDVQSDTLRQFLTRCKEEHLTLQGEIQALLNQYHDEGKDPNPIAKGIGLGSSAHAIGTAKAMELGEVESVMGLYLNVLLGAVKGRVRRLF